MKRKVYKIHIFLIISFILLSGPACNRRELSLEQIISETPGAILKEIKADTMYSAAWKIMIPQPLDHKHPEKGNFMQRIWVSEVDPGRPVVFITEGYSANRNYTSELSRLLEANQIIVEHRYFGESVPDSMIWNYLTVEQAAADHHRIVQILKKLFKGKWINTGISKGGQTTMYHRYFYPEDVDISVPYVAPLNFSIEDPRIYLFLDTVGTPECRKKIYNFQKLLLEKRDDIYPMFLDTSKSLNLTYTRITPEEAYEYCVLEYSFAFWQWGYWSCKDIPPATASNKDILKHFSEVGGFRYFSDQGIADMEPFFYQAMTEIGYYGYDFSEFGGFLKYVKNPVFTFAAPQNTDLTFHPQLMEDVNAFLQNKASHFIYIYGGSDTWSATSVDIGDNNQSLKIYKPHGSHRTRIKDLLPQQKSDVFSALESWLEIDIDASRLK